MNKCMNCEHADRVNEKIIYCSYFRCVKEDGWIADKQRKVADEKNNQTTNQSDKQTI